MHLLSLSAIATCVASAAVTAGEIGFRSPVVIPVRLTAIDVVKGDFDGDGKLDLAATGGSSAIPVLMQDPADRARWTLVGPLEVGMGNFSLLSADIDGDGRSDLVACDPARTAWSFRSKGLGEFRPPEALTEMGEWPMAGIAADLSGDGKIDLALVNIVGESAGELVLRSGRGDGTFAEAARLPIPKPMDLEVLDLDLDGRLDLVVAPFGDGVTGGDAPDFYLLRSLGGWTFSSASIPGSAYLSVQVADVNLDGYPDILAGQSILENRDGADLLVHDCPPDQRAWAAVDFDGDGLPDLASSPSDPQMNPAWFVQVSPGRGDFTFGSPERMVPFLSWPFMLAGDLDRDGLFDVVVPGPNSVDVFWGAGGGRSLDPAYVFFPVPAGTSSAVADIDGSGLADLVVIESKHLYAFMDPGRSPTAGPRTNSVSRSFSACEAADLDGDGAPEVAGLTEDGAIAVVSFTPGGNVSGTSVLSAGRDAVAFAVGELDPSPGLEVAVLFRQEPYEARVFQGAGAGSFDGGPAVPTIAAPRGAAVGDLDLDGRGDLVVFGDRRAAVQFGLGGQELGEPLLLEEGMRSFAGVEIADVDGDGRPDVLAAERSTGTVRIYRGAGDRTFAAPEAIEVGVVAERVAAADLDGDGLPDIVAFSGIDESIAVLPGGPGGFGKPMLYPVGFPASDFHLADCDGDAIPDALVSNSLMACVLTGFLRPGGGPSYLRGDATGDGRLDLTDAILVLGRLFLGGLPLGCDDAADATDDGTLDLSDPITVLGSLFLGDGPLLPPGPGVCGPDPTGDELACETGCR
jgi:hypothetical protein